MLKLFNTIGHNREQAQPFAGGVMPADSELLRDWLKGAGVKKATLYGSALYATQLGYPGRHNDYDIIVGHTDPRWWILPQKLARNASFEYSSDNPMQPRRLYYTLSNGLKVDVCCMYAPRSPQFMAEHSLFGISAIAADLFSGQVWARREFHEHAAQRVIRPLPDTPRDYYGTVLHYADKMCDKFPGFAVDIPHGFRPA